MGEQEKKELSPEEEFGKAFDEITGVTPSSEEKVEGKEESIPHQDNVEKETPENVAGQIPESDQPTQTNKPDETDYKTLYEQEVQKTKSWAGRIRKANEQAEAAKAEAVQLRVELNQLKEKSKTPPKIDNTEDDPDIRQMFEDYPELAKPFEKLVLKVGTKIAQEIVQTEIEKINPRIEAAEKKLIANTNDAHFDAITKAHNGWQEWIESGEVQEWIDSQPQYAQRELNRIVKHGSTEEAIELLDQFKKFKVNKTTVTQPSTKKDPGSLIAVPAGKTEVPKPKDDSIKDFDYWWEEATKERK